MDADASLPATSSSLAILASLIALLITLSVVTERLVEIIKNIPWLGEWLTTDQDTPGKERVRRLVLQMLAVGAGVGTAFLSRSVLPIIEGTFVKGPETAATACWLLGLLASGGSGFWTSILGYVNNIRAIKQDESVKAKVQAAATAVSVSEGRLPLAASLPVMRAFSAGTPAGLSASSEDVQTKARATLKRVLGRANATL